MAMAARTMGIPIATATTSTSGTGAFWFATSHRELGPDGPHPANTAMDIVSALASLVRVTETGSFSAVARERDVSKAAVHARFPSSSSTSACGLSDDVQHGSESFFRPCSVGSIDKLYSIVY
jgi:hypothetical protein